METVLVEQPMVGPKATVVQATKSGATFPIATAICALQIAKVTDKMADTAIQENVLVSKEFSKTTMLLTMTILLLLLLHKKRRSIKNIPLLTSLE